MVEKHLYRMRVDFSQISPIFVDFFYLGAGPSTRVRFCVRIIVRFRAQFCLGTDYISYTNYNFLSTHLRKNQLKIYNYKPHWAGNCTWNRIAIRTKNRMCRRPLNRRFLKRVEGATQSQSGGHKLSDIVKDTRIRIKMRRFVRVRQLTIGEIYMN
jgi:hypothetical protein